MFAAKVKYAKTALHIASRYGQEAVARLLLEQEADVVIEGIYWVTALHVAARYGHEVARLLLSLLSLENGAGVAAV